MILTLTSAGKRRAKDIVSRGPESSVLSVLEENGPSEITEIARDLGTSSASIKTTAVKLVKRGLVTKDES